MSVDEKRVHRKRGRKELGLAAPAGWGTCRLAAMQFLTIAPGVLPEVARGLVNADDAAFGFQGAR